MKKKLKLFCFGFGQVAKYFVKNLIQNDFDFDLVATNTKNTRLQNVGDLKYKSYYFSNNNFDKDLTNDLSTSNKVLISIPPVNQTDIVLKIFSKIFQKNKFDWVTYLSATSIYGDKKGKWVDEDAILDPTSRKGMARLKAEKEWVKFYKNFNLPVQIFRLSGIYSLENNIMKRLKMGKVKIVEKKNHFFSRIHVEDIARILTISLNKFKSGEIYNVSDNYPSSNYEIIKYASNLMKMNMPSKIKTIDIENKILKDFYKDSKKVNNKKIKTFFNYKFKYPTYKEGLSVIKNKII